MTERKYKETIELLEIIKRSLCPDPHMGNAESMLCEIVMDMLVEIRELSVRA